MQNFLAEEAPGKVVCVIGLGNPGAEYRFTRHNAGYRVVGLLAESQKIALREGTGEYLFSEFRVDDKRVLLVLPTTYMNESGMAVLQVMEHFSLNVDDLIVVYDDFQLPLGTLRFRAGGTDGGHNGLASVIYHVQSDKIARLRLGIAGSTCPTEDRKDLMADYVLSPFNKDEGPIAAQTIEHARDALLALTRHGMHYAMNNFNRSFLENDPKAKQ